MDVAKALGGSFKLVTLAPETVREMNQLPKETDATKRKGGQVLTTKTKAINTHQHYSRIKRDNTQ